MTDARQVVDLKEITNAVRQSHGLSPEEEEERYESMIDMVVKTHGKKASDELFEQAKEIITIRQNELLATGEYYIIDDEDEDAVIIDGVGKVEKVSRPQRPKRD